MSCHAYYFQFPFKHSRVAWQHLSFNFICFGALIAYALSRFAHKKYAINAGRQ